MMDGSTQAFDQAIITAPAPQTEAMLVGAHPDMAAALAAVEIAPNWTLMLVFEEELDPGFTVWREAHPVLGWVARNSSKPGRDFSGDSWTVQATADWSTEYLELEKEDAAAHFLMRFRHWLAVSCRRCACKPRTVGVMPKPSRRLGSHSSRTLQAASTWRAIGALGRGWNMPLKAVEQPRRR